MDFPYLGILLWIESRLLNRYRSNESLLLDRHRSYERLEWWWLVWKNNSLVTIILVLRFITMPSDHKTKTQDYDPSSKVHQNPGAVVVLLKHSVSMIFHTIAHTADCPNRQDQHENVPLHFSL